MAYHTGCRLWFPLSLGCVGAGDGWQDLMNNYKMDWEFRAAGSRRLFV
jgi:hypothetical protein